MNRAIPVLLLVLTVSTLTACTLTRAEQLARQSDRVESRLLRERDNAAKVRTADSAARLDHLSQLRTELTLADAARKLAPRLLQDPNQVEAAYDVLEEVYSTIEWNIPLLPTDTARRPLPSVFGPSGFDFSRLQPVAPRP